MLGKYYSEHLWIFYLTVFPLKRKRVMGKKKISLSTLMHMKNAYAITFCSPGQKLNELQSHDPN